MPNLAPEYQCTKCERVFDLDQYKKSVFCPFCEMHLWPKFVRIEGGAKPQRKGKGTTVIEPIDPSVEVNLSTIFAEFNRLTNIDIGEGELMDDVPSWDSEKKKAYNDFRARLSLNKLVGLEKLCEDYRQFLYFDNNHSWTNLHRRGLKALSNPERLWEFITHIQDESVPIETRIQNSLEGKYYIFGIGQNICTGLLHMFNPDEYGVWNTRTNDTLNLIRRKPSKALGIGNKYVAINQELRRLALELDCDLTTIDGLMWYVSKRLKSRLLDQFARLE